jgi:DNA-binding PadR family transcriptional regulator
MAERQLLGEVEQLVLLAILRIGEDAYAVPIREELARNGGVSLSRGTIYVTLDRLERKGYVTSTFTDPTPEPGGKARRCFRIERQGVMALRAAHRMIDRLRAGTVLDHPHKFT